MDVNDNERPDDDEVDELVSELLHRSSMVVVCYENLLRSREPQDTSKDLARAMKDLKEILPDELLEVIRG